MVKSRIETARDEFDAKMLELAGEVERGTAALSEHPQHSCGTDRPVPDTSPATPDLLRLETLLKIQGTAIEQLRAEITSAVNPGLLEEVLEQLKRKNALESANEKLFEALHRELRDYKDAFLFESLQKPFVQDLLHLLAELNKIATQLDVEASKPPGENSGVMLANLKNVISSVGEILERLQVSEIPCMPGERLDLRLHKTSGCEPAPTQKEDNQILKILRPGYFWRDRVIRPVEVVVGRWSPTNS